MGPAKSVLHSQGKTTGLDHCDLEGVLLRVKSGRTGSERQNRRGERGKKQVFNYKQRRRRGGRTMAGGRNFFPHISAFSSYPHSLLLPLAYLVD